MKKLRQLPTLDEVRTLAMSNRKSIHSANRFFAHYEANKWRTGQNKPLKNWMVELTRWIAKEEKQALKTGY